MKQALIICRNEHLSWSLPNLLQRAGFAVDVLSCAGIFKRSRFVRDVYALPDEEFLADYICDFVAGKSFYDWILVTEDPLLSEIMASNVSLNLKLKILPVMAEKDFQHLCSKTGLADVLQRHNILAPRFEVAATVAEARQAARRLGYPIMLKRNLFHGGTGVYECQGEADIDALDNCFDGSALLVQEKIIGIELDVSALYRDGQLIHFNYAMPRKTVTPRGPSCVRDYVPLKAVDQVVFRELQQIGQALGANGFTNIACIETPENKRYYFEADMRPNTWTDFSRFIDDDSARHIHNWFFNGQPLDVREVGGEKQKLARRIPMFLRLSNLELLLNRYHVWKFIPWQDYRLVAHMLLQKLIVDPILQLASHLVPDYFKHLRRMRSKAGTY